MVIPIDEVLNNKWVTNREFGNGEGLVEPEGVGLDFRLGQVSEMVTGNTAFLGKTKRATKEYKLLKNFKPGVDEKVALAPGKYYLLSTVEKFKMPSHVVGRFIARYNLLAGGIMVLGYKVDPGYEGIFNVPVINLSPDPFEIELGARFCQFEFHQIDGDGVLYRGQWKGGRLHSDGLETQV